MSNYAPSSPFGSVLDETAFFRNKSPFRGDKARGFGGLGGRGMGSSSSGWGSGAPFFQAAPLAHWGGQGGPAWGHWGAHQAAQMPPAVGSAFVPIGQGHPWPGAVLGLGGLGGLGGVAGAALPSM